EMVVVRVWTGGREYTLDGSESALDDDASPLHFALEIAALASRRQAGRDGSGHGAGHDPVDAAVVRAAARLEPHQRRRGDHRRAGLVPFSSERKLMAVFHTSGANDTIAYVKGAPGRIIDLSHRAVTADSEAPLDEPGRARLRQINHGLARQGLRVLAIAYGA